MKILFGRLVLVALIVFGVWYVVDHYHGVSKFGCQAGGTLAHADDATCPASIQQAVKDPQWAAARLATIPRTGSTTTGLFYDPDGHEIHFTSGEDLNADRVNQILRQAGVAFPAKGVAYPASSHVEAKAAAIMRDVGVDYGVMVINNEGGVCSGDYGCEQVLDAVLPPGATLVVWSPPTIGKGKPDQYTGRSGS